ncbi:MAG: GGDEF domain-containing protein, partial [Desulfobacteraceae bacterium]|nr:GGDEF domain-containing protein [Desulfobacteraceae bacterium]
MEVRSEKWGIRSAKIERSGFFAPQTATKPLRSIFALRNPAFMLLCAKRHENRKFLFFPDLDRYTQVNDVYGHEAGDKLLKEVAARLRESVRETDHVCRLGGDEFTIILNTEISS